MIDDPLYGSVSYTQNYETNKPAAPSISVPPVPELPEAEHDAYLALACSLGCGNSIFLSSRPDRSSAGSRMSTRLVAAITCRGQKGVMVSGHTQQILASDWWSRVVRSIEHVTVRGRGNG